MADLRPGAALGLEGGESPGTRGLAPASAGPKHASAELLDRIYDDLTFLVQTVEAKYHKSLHERFIAALKALDPLYAVVLKGLGDGEA